MPPRFFLLNRRKNCHSNLALEKGGFSPGGTTCRPLLKHVIIRCTVHPVTDQYNSPRIYCLFYTLFWQVLIRTEQAFCLKKSNRVFLTSSLKKVLCWFVSWNSRKMRSLVLRVLKISLKWDIKWDISSSIWTNLSEAFIEITFSSLKSLTYIWSSFKNKAVTQIFECHKLFVIKSFAFRNALKVKCLWKQNFGILCQIRNLHLGLKESKN